MDKQEYFLEKHGIVLDKRKSPEEQNQQMKIAFGVKDIENGDKPYIFISYSHKDSAVVFPAIKALQERGYPVWYDDSIRTGVAWRTHIAERVRNSALVIAFMSENSVASKNCIAEVDHAIDLNLPILTVRLDQSQIPSGLGMYLNRDQMFKAYLYDGDAYITRLAAEPIIAETAGAALEVYSEKKRREAEEAEEEIKRLDAEETEIRKLSQEKKRERGLDELRLRLVKMEAARKTHEELLGFPLEEEEGKKQLEVIFKQAQESLLTDGSYRYTLAMFYVQRRMKTIVKFIPSLQADMEYYQNRMCEMVYQEARILEKTDNYREALGRYDALGEGYRDSRKRFDNLFMKQERRYRYWLIITALVYCINHYLKLTSFDGHLLTIVAVYALPMIAAFLSTLLGSIICFGFLERASERMRSTYVFVIVVVGVISVIMDVFAFSGIPIWQRILRSLWYNVLGAIIGLIVFLCVFNVCINAFSLLDKHDII